RVFSDARRRRDHRAPCWRACAPWVARHAPHDEKGDHAVIGDAAAERGLCAVPVNEALACRSWLEAFQIAIGGDGTMGGGHGATRQGKRRAPAPVLWSSIGERPRL